MHFVLEKFNEESAFCIRLPKVKYLEIIINHTKIDIFITMNYSSTRTLQFKGHIDSFTRLMQQKKSMV